MLLCPAPRVPRPALLLALMSSLVFAPTTAQDRSSHYLHLDHWAYRYVDLLIERGQLTQLQPLLRPYRRLDIARAIDAADTDGSLDAVEREWVDLLRNEFTPELERPPRTADSALTYLRGGIAGGAWGLSDRHRDVLRPEGDAAVTFRVEGERHAPEIQGWRRITARDIGASAARSPRTRSRRRSAGAPLRSGPSGA